MPQIVRRAAATVVVAFAVALLTPAGAFGASTAVVPVTINGAIGSVNGAQPIVQVEVGNSAPIPVVLDTGSIGLHVFATQIASGAGNGITLTKRPFTEQFLDGTVYKGVVGIASITVGNLTTSPISVGIVNSISCTAAKPNCPTVSGNMTSRTSYGVMGVGVDAPGADGLANPLPALPNGAGNGWSLQFSGDSGSLTLGVTAPTGSTVFNMSAEGAASNGIAYWNDTNLPVCYTIAKTAQTCTPTLFDSGNPSMIIFGGTLATVASGAVKSQLLKPGTSVSVSSAAGSAFWTFRADTPAKTNRVHVRPQGSGVVNASIAAFFANAIYYSVRAGTVSVA